MIQPPANTRTGMWLKWALPQYWRSQSEPTWLCGNLDPCLDPARWSMASAGLGFWRGFVVVYSSQRSTSTEQVCTHLVDEAGKLSVERLDLFLLLTAYFMFQRVDPNAEGLQEPFVNADTLDAISFAIRVTSHNTISPGATKANPSSNTTVAYTSKAELSKTSSTADSIHVGNSPVSTQVADTPAAIGTSSTSDRLAGRGSVASTTNLRSWTEASSSQDRSHCRCLSAHRGLFEGGIWKFRGSSSAGEEQRSRWSDTVMLPFIYIWEAGLDRIRTLI